MRNEQDSARRRLGEGDFPGRGKACTKGLKARKHGFSEVAKKMQVRGWARALGRPREA